MDITQLAAMITEDPDVFLNVLTEAPDSFYLPSFNNSRIPVPAGYPIGQFVMQQLGLNKSHAAGWEIIDKNTGKPRTLELRDLPTEERLNIIHRVKAIVPPQFAKFEPYYVKQVTTGNLHLHKIEEDSERLNNTIALFIKFSRKAVWDGPTDIYKFPNWRQLEQKTNELADKHIDYDASADSEVIYTKQYTNNALSLLLGGPPEITTYWFRVIDSLEAACKYGKGTTWCTSTTPKGPRGTPEYDDHAFHNYHNHSGLYIIEMQSPHKPRRPILQISGDEFTDSNDTPVAKVGPRLADFFGDVLKNAVHKLNPKTASVLARHAGVNFDTVVSKSPYRNAIQKKIFEIFARHIQIEIDSFTSTCNDMLSRINQDKAVGALASVRGVKNYLEMHVTRKLRRFELLLASDQYYVEELSATVADTEGARKLVLDAINEIKTTAAAVTKVLQQLQIQ